MSITVDQRRREVLAVDWNRCAGHGVCAAAFGEQVGLDEWGYPRGKGAPELAVPEHQRRAAKLAVRVCPEAALRLVQR